uniref:Sarcospan n=1 Tax=Felis catus TaxID=9685 RepID=A0ABI7Y1B4_FELCA
MGKDKQPRGQRRQGGPAADAAGPDDMGPKTGKRAPKECGEEEARTCCGCRFPLLLALLQLALGIAVTVLGFLMASISSSLLVRDTPFWAGIIDHNSTCFMGFCDDCRGNPYKALRRWPAQSK